MTSSATRSQHEAGRGPEIRIDDATGADTVALLELHAAGMEASSPPGACHYFDVEQFRRAEVTLWTAWFDRSLAGCGAMVELDAHHGEIKSMRTAPSALGRGVGRALLDHIVAVAIDRGYRRLSLETGRGEAFAAAVRLYETSEFERCPPFGDYTASEFSQFFTREL